MGEVIRSSHSFVHIVAQMPIVPAEKLMGAHTSLLL